MSTQLIVIISVLKHIKYLRAGPVRVLQYQYQYSVLGEGVLVVVFETTTRRVVIKIFRDKSVVMEDEKYFSLIKIPASILSTRQISRTKAYGGIQN